MQRCSPSAGGGRSPGVPGARYGFKKSFVNSNFKKSFVNGNQTNDYNLITIVIYAGGRSPGLWCAGEAVQD